MKANFKLLLLPLLFLTSCVKEYSFEKGEPYYLNFTVDGVPKTSIKFAAGDHTDPGNGNLELFGTTDTIPDSRPYIFSFEIVSHTKKIIVGEYIDSDPDFFLIGVYTDSINAIHYLTGSTLLQQAASAGVAISNHFKLTVTSFENHSVRGTFSGDFYENGDPKSRMVKITNGDFYIRMN